MDDDSDVWWSFFAERDKLEVRTKVQLRDRLAPFVPAADLDDVVEAILPVVRDFGGSYETLSERRRSRAQRGFST